MPPQPEAYAITDQHREMLDPEVARALANPDRAFHPTDLWVVFEAVAANRQPGIWMASVRRCLPATPLEEDRRPGDAEAVAEGVDPHVFWREHFELPEQSDT